MREREEPVIPRPDVTPQPDKPEEDRHGVDVDIEITSATNRLLAAKAIGGQHHVDALASLTDVLANKPGAVEELMKRQRNE